MSNRKDSSWASSVAEAKRNARIDITGPSGTRYSLRALTLEDLIVIDGLPQDLLHAALLEMTPARTILRPDGSIDTIPGGIVGEIAEKTRLGDPEQLEQARKLSQATVALRDRIVLEAVVAPRLKPADLADLDPFDKEMIVGIAQRRIVVDAEGKQVGADELAPFRAAGQGS